MKTRKLEVCKEDIELNSIEGFEKRYFEYLEICRTASEAFKKANDDYFRIFGHDKYSSYDSFRIVRNRKMKKNKLTNIN